MSAQMSIVQVQDFNASVYVSEQLNRQLINMSQDLAHRCVAACAERYNFDAEEAYRLLGLAMIKLERKVPMKAKTEKTAKVAMPKAAFPLPYNGEFNDACCYALRQNNGLYTQCTGVRKGEKGSPDGRAQFCKSCATTMQKTGAEMPEYGTIQQRMAVDIFEYVDPKGRKPIAYTKVMKKYKISEDQVMEEAGKLNININSNHFVAPTEDSKRGRPKAAKEPKAKGAKGRPKKEKKVLMIEGDDDDLFASLVAEANEDADEEMVIAPKAKKAGKSDEEKEAERLAKEAEKAEKEAKRLAEKAEKEAKLAAEKAEKEAKKEAERLAREAKKAEEEAAKKQKEEQRLKEKADKEAKLAAEKAAKEASKSKSSKKAAQPEEDEEPDVVKKIEFEGKKYLKSKKTGIIYDYNEYVKNGEQVVIGKWVENKIVFEADEEEEEEYDM
jgi:chemotaxis protein histidine kinase CheA